MNAELPCFSVRRRWIPREDVDVYGRTTRHGPIVVQAGQAGRRISADKSGEGPTPPRRLPQQ